MSDEKVYIIGIGTTPVGKLDRKVIDLLSESIDLAFKNANTNVTDSNKQLTYEDVSTLLTCAPSQGGSTSSQIAPFLIGFVPRDSPLFFKVIDIGGCGPVACVVEGFRILKDSSSVHSRGIACISVADAVGSVEMQKIVENPGAKSPVNFYDVVAKWHAEKYGTKREQFAMVSSLMSQHASWTEGAMTKSFVSVEEILGSRAAGQFTTIKECARKADGGATILLANESFLRNNPWLKNRAVEIIGVGENSNLINFRKFPPEIKPEYFSLKFAFLEAMKMSQKTVGNNFSVEDVEFFGIYDCFPIAFMKAIEDMGITPEGTSGNWIEEKFKKFLEIKEKFAGNSSEIQKEFVKFFPFNSHGGLMHFAAPWECPAAYNVTEAVRQLRSEIEIPEKQVKFRNKSRYAIATGNGGIFAFSGVLILKFQEGTSAKL